jgi:hypothetical protein
MVSRNDLDSFPWPKAKAPPQKLEGSIRRACTEQLVPVRPMTPRRRTVWSVISSGAIFAVLLAIGWMRHPPESAVTVALAGALVWGIVQAAVLWVGMSRPPGRRPPRTLRWAAIGVVLAGFFVYLTVAATHALSPAEFLDKPGSTHSTVVCGVHALLFGLLAAGVLLALWRRTDPFSPRLTGAVAGLGGGLVGGVALDMTCRSLEAWHLWLGHGLMLALVVVAGWAVGRRWLSP